MTNATITSTMKRHGLSACRGAGLAIALVACVVAVGPAQAHAMLKAARPGVGSTVTAAPRAIEIDFTEGVVPKFCGIVVKSAAGKAVALGKPANGGAGAASLVVPVEGSLAPGVYTVAWHAVSVDTHRTQGSFRFTVAP